MQSPNTQHGYSLVEVLVAISILLIAVVGPMSIAVKGIQSARYTKDQTTAVFLAQEGIEGVVAIRNEALRAALQAGDLTLSWDWVTDATLASCFGSGCNFDYGGVNGGTDVLSAISPVSCSTSGDCLMYFDTGVSSRAVYNASGVGDPTIFTRVIKLVETNDNKGVIITSEVTWNSGLFTGGARSVKLESGVYQLYE